MQRDKRSRGKIGVFDSGVGGLTVLHPITQAFPQYDYLYLADSARAPYGSRSQRTIRRYTQEAVDSLIKSGCELIILACNTASSEALRYIQHTYLPRQHGAIKVLGIIIPTAEETARITRNRQVGVLATEATVLSLAFHRELQKINPQIRVFQQACPALVPLIESGQQDGLQINRSLKQYLMTLLRKDIDTLILGCTHYEWLRPWIRRLTPKHIRIVSAAQLLPKKLGDYLQRHPEIEQHLRRGGTVHYMTTGDPDRFSSIARVWDLHRLPAEHICLAPKPTCHFCYPHVE